jgi:crotonobetainyl-CoA:carnitine CoA-transferase CaiB-like acyl-CoA transferase
VGQAERGTQPHHATNALRRADRPAIVAEIQELLRQHGRTHWLDLLEAAGIPAGPINRVDEIAADPELIERGLLFKMRKGGRTIPQVGLGIQVDGEACAPRMPPPDLGEHTEAILSRWAGYDAARVAALREQGII